MTRFHGEINVAIGRNDPCLCGSGKKHKKCCGKNEAETLLVQQHNQSLQAVLQDFFETHPRPSEQKRLLDWKNKTEDYLVPLYGEDKAGGIIGDVYFFSKHVEIWNDFIDQKLQKESRPQLRLVLESWKNPVFLGGEILSIADYQAEMRDLLSGTAYELDVNESFPVEAGNIALGFYLPDPRKGSRFLMALNSVTAAVDVNRETVQKLKDMHKSSDAQTIQEFYRQNAIAIYQMFSSGLRSAQQTSAEVLAAVQELDQFLIGQDLKSDDLIEAYYHFLEGITEVPPLSTGGAVYFGIRRGLLKLDWPLEQVAAVFETEETGIAEFAERLGDFYDSALAGQEKEASYAFEVGTNPKANELQNWQLFMHLKNAAISSETALKRQMEYYHEKPYEPKSPSEKAQLLAYELFAKDAPEDFQEVQRFDPHLADGFLLAASAETDPTAQKALLEKAAASSKAHFEQEMEIPWLYIGNRPYLRALFLLGIHYWQQANYEQAFIEFKNLLQLNPGDHQGARYLAAASLIALGRLEEAESLIAHYEDEYSDNAFYSWFKWLIQRKRNVHSKTAQDLFLKAVEQNPYVKKQIDKRPAALPYPKKGALTPRSPEEAQLIWTFLAPSLL